MNTILVVDDDERLLFLITKILEEEGFKVEGAISASQARIKLKETHFDAMVVDWMMPNETGLDLIKSIRNSASHLANIPAVMLTAVDDIDHKIEGFESGVDDYITKPFEGKELVLRLQALIRRTSRKETSPVQKFGNCEFNTETDELRLNGTLIYLSTTELILLKTLAQRPNEPFSRIELAKKLSFLVSDRTIDVQITRLRKKIGDNPKKPTIIKTIRYIGYALCITDQPNSDDEQSI